MTTEESNTKAVVIAGVEILQDAAGRYSLNALHQASNTSNAKRPGQWLKRKSTQELINELDSQVSFAPIMVTHGGAFGGTWAHPQLAEDYQSWLRNRPRKKAIHGYVYVVQYKKEYPYKIGSTDNPQSRLRILQYASPVPLAFRYLWLVAHPTSVEKLLHEHFAHRRTHGEWFALTEADEDILRRKLTTYKARLIKEMSGA